jgi:hypothetical protein
MIDARPFKVLIVVIGKQRGRRLFFSRSSNRRTIHGQMHSSLLHRLSSLFTADAPYCIIVLAFADLMPKPATAIYVK